MPTGRAALLRGAAPKDVAAERSTPSCRNSRSNLATWNIALALAVRGRILVGIAPRIPSGCCSVIKGYWRRRYGHQALRYPARLALLVCSDPVKSGDSSGTATGLSHTIHMNRWIHRLLCTMSQNCLSGAAYATFGAAETLPAQPSGGEFWRHHGTVGEAYRTVFGQLFYRASRSCFSRILSGVRVRSGFSV
jgi:hypothetical protein